ncbi:hypothetical protein TNCV_4692231 [Trichonephila clavipes]|nr:hypothetical protein TNCV_4692231 [Trichonephila clavipes]
MTLDSEVDEEMLRLGGQVDAKIAGFSPQVNLVLIYQPTEGLKAESTLPSSGFQLGAVKRDTLPLSHWTILLYF